MPSRINPGSGHGYRFKDRAGQRNGRLVFLRPIGITQHKHTVWEAVCDCGAITETAVPHKTRSCGCLQREMAAEVQRRKALPADVKAASNRANQVRQRERRRADPIVAMQSRLSRLHRFALARVGAIKASPTFVALGYTAGEFVRHIERQFTKGMGWHNMHLWQIDHVIPSSAARCEEDVIALNQLSNLRPMWSRENNAKKDRRTSLL